VTKHTPATPLPWTHQATRKPMMPLVAANGEWISSPYNRVGDIEDFEYIAHAANAYPKLVEALREVIAGRYEADASRARALLRELGEDA
jgi:hypothetical protein